MTKEEKDQLYQSIDAAGREIWMAAMTLLRKTDPADPEDTPIRHAGEILSSLGYIIDECEEMIYPTK